MKQNKITFKNNNAGYTLISMAISLMIIGIIAAVGFEIYNRYHVEMQTTTTEQRVQQAIAKIENFRSINGRYPCPSSITATRGHPSYGKDNQADCINSGPLIPTGTCVNGVCVINSDPTRIAISPTVRIGAIPFRDLQMDERDAYDAYGSRLLYAVTEKLGVENTFKETEGGINIIDEGGNNVISPQGSANFVILSNGPNRIGAFAVDGIQVSSCPTFGSTIESHNCVDLTAPPTNAEFASSFTSLAGGATDFDDTIDYFSTLFDPTWKRTTSNNENIEALITKSIGAGVEKPVEGLELSQSPAISGGNGVGNTWDGGLRVSSDVTNSSLQANKFCQQDGTQCFDVEDLAGPTGIKCSNPGEYLIGIKGNGTNAVPICSSVKVQCNAGYVLNGFDASGKPLCVKTYTNCPDGTIQICSSAAVYEPRNSNHIQTNATPIAFGVHSAMRDVTDTTPYSFAGNPKRARFQCVNGIWIIHAELDGFCGNKCTPPIWAGADYSGTSTTEEIVNCSGAMSGYEKTMQTTTCSFSLKTCLPACTASAKACNCASYFPVVDGKPTTGPSGNPPPLKPTDAISACGAGYNVGNKTESWIWDSSDAVCNWKSAGVASTCSCDASKSGDPPATDPGKSCSLLVAGTDAKIIAPPIWKFDPTPGQCKWNLLGYDTSVCKCDMTTEHASTSTHASTCNLACDNESVPAVWVFKYKVDASGNCVPGDDYIKKNAICGEKPFNLTAVTRLESFAAQPSNMKECDSDCRISPKSDPVTPPTPVAGGEACSELNKQSACWKAEGNYVTYKAICQAK